ncbi:MAG: hypothetical protein QXQ53_03830 [Candidatus Methanosuratincola sp.]
MDVAGNGVLCVKLFHSPVGVTHAQQVAPFVKEELNRTLYIPTLSVPLYPVPFAYRHITRSLTESGPQVAGREE